MADLTTLTSTSFGYLIAYFPAGLVALLGASFWVKSLKTIFMHFENSSADLGLFLLVLLLAATVSLILLIPRWLLFERWLLHCKEPSPASFSKLGEAGRASAYQVAVEQHYRYHQFYGGMLFGSIVLFVGWYQHTEMTGPQQLASIVGFAVLEFLLFLAAFDSLSRYFARGSSILDGVT
ncbi:MAG: hypothetical protein WB565_14775 [Acidimicrobiales bacterium]